MWGRASVYGVSLFIAVSMAGSVYAGKYNRVLNVGDPAPRWNRLPAADGNGYELDSWRDCKAVVVVFTCDQCPVAQAYQDRLIRLATDYKDRSVALVLVNVNDGESLEQMQRCAEEKGFDFPYLRDDTQQSARAYGATCTPHAFLLGPDRKIAYMGAIDDNWQDGAAAETHYLRDAIDAVLAGHPPAETETRQVGCAIQWKP